MQTLKNIEISSYIKSISLYELILKLKSPIDSNRDYLIQVISHRIKNRYLKLIDDENNRNSKTVSGFMLMAICCLLIETIECFYEGANNSFDKDVSKPGKRYVVFMKFFERKNDQLKELSDDNKAKSFYDNIRCGILHQAETIEWRLKSIDGERIIDFNNKLIDAKLFYKAINDRVNDYLNDLKNGNMTELLWNNSINKLIHICDNCYLETLKRKLISLRKAFYTNQIDESEYEIQMTNIMS